MPVDRSDPADDPNEPAHRPQPDDPRSSVAAPPLPLDQASRVTAHRENRAEVEQIYAAHQESARGDPPSATADADAHRGSWDEALPSLRAAWEQHQDRYPERERATPRTHTDGSWSSGEARRLTPEQNTEATKACADIHDEGERVALPDMRQLEAADPDRGLSRPRTHAQRRRPPQGEDRGCGFAAARDLSSRRAQAARHRTGRRAIHASHTAPSRITPMVYSQTSSASRGSRTTRT